MPPVAPANLPEPAIIAPAMHPEELSAEGNALVGEMCDLQLLAQGTGLTLDSRQWSALAAVVLRAQATRLTFEARIATAKMIAPGKYRLEIPAYANAGNVLREQFTHELCAELGEPVAVDVLAKLGPKLEGRFAGYGVSEQTLEITNADGPPDDVQVTRTATYWNGMAGNEGLATHRDTHFPGLEDPTGDTWGALLAMVGESGAENGPG